MGGFRKLGRRQGRKRTTTAEGSNKKGAAL